MPIMIPTTPASTNSHQCLLVSVERTAQSMANRPPAMAKMPNMNVKTNSERPGQTHTRNPNTIASRPRPTKAHLEVVGEVPVGVHVEVPMIPSFLDYLSLIACAQIGT